MKIGIITLINGNYGALLQTFALAKKINDLGAEAEVLRYNDKNRITHGMSLIRICKYYMKKLMLFVMTGNGKVKKFDKFTNDYIPLTKRKYTLRSELLETSPEYDVYVSGGDQIWNPDIFCYDTSYFLDFVPDNKRRVSYASSFGKVFFNAVNKEKYGEFLRKYKYISVRETSGRAVIRELCGEDAEAEICLDSTLLLDKSEWNKLYGNYNGRHYGKKYILCYVIPGDDLVTNAIDRIAEKLSADTGFPIMRIGIHEYQILKYDRKSYDLIAGIDDFLYMFSNAEYVITNSYHGTAFSINFGVPFYVPVNGNISAETALHERIISILCLFGLENLIIPVKNDVDVMNINIPAVHGIDFKKISEKLIYERQKSISYLKKAIEANGL